MSIYAIADLHLSFSENVHKPMDIFGAEWANHAERLQKNWSETVTDDDTVLVIGDVSWALKPEDAIADLDWISKLPGQKVMIKGNHDLWWTSAGKLNRQYEPDIRFLHNNFYEVEGRAICGSRGWVCPGDETFTEHDEKIYRREILRLGASLEAAKKAGFTDIIGAMHFPPAADRRRQTGFTELFEAYGVKQVLYGHLHGRDKYNTAIRGSNNNVEYRLVSLDYLACVPLLVGQ